MPVIATSSMNTFIKFRKRSLPGSSRARKKRTCRFKTSSQVGGNSLAMLRNRRRLVRRHHQKTTAATGNPANHQGETVPASTTTAETITPVTINAWFRFSASSAGVISISDACPIHPEFDRDLIGRECHVPELILRRPSPLVLVKLIRCKL